MIYSLNPHPSSLIPQPSSLIHQPSTLNPQPSTSIPQPSTLIHQPIAIGDLLRKLFIIRDDGSIDHDMVAAHMYADAKLRKISELHKY